MTRDEHHAVSRPLLVHVVQVGVEVLTPHIRHLIPVVEHAHAEFVEQPGDVFHVRTVFACERERHVVVVRSGVVLHRVSIIAGGGRIPRPRWDCDCTSVSACRPAIEARGSVARRNAGTRSVRKPRRWPIDVDSPCDSLQLIMAFVAAWLQREQHEMIEYLREENRILRAQLHGRRLRLTDDERRRLAVLGARLGRPILTRWRRSSRLRPSCAGTASSLRASGHTRGSNLGDRGCSRRFAGSWCGWLPRTRAGAIPAFRAP